MRDPEDLGCLQMCFQWCPTLQGIDAARQALESIQRSGGWSESARLQPGYDPLTLIRHDGSGPLGGVGHPKLEADIEKTWDIKRGLAPSTAKGFAHAQVEPQSRQLVLIQHGSYYVQGDEGVDRTMRGLLAFAGELYPFLSPLYGFIDNLGDNTPKAEDVLRFDLKELSWANIFGAVYVEHIGREFLHAAPAWLIRDLPDGGVMLVATESYVHWRYHTDRDEDTPFDDMYTWNHPLAVYFQQKFPDIRAFKPIPIPDYRSRDDVFGS